METVIPEKTNKQSAWELVRFALLAVAIVIPIRLFIAQPFIVSGSSMVPTFSDGQYLIIDEISYKLGSPERNDVVVFRYPNDTKKFFIKRIIGLPNETIEINNGKVTVYPCDKSSDCTGMTLSEPYIDETFNTTKNYSTRDNEYFVMGDNRNASSDSRSWGTVPKKLLIGRAFLRLLPINKIGLFPGSFPQAE
jgi:signal peptidase I